MKTFSKSIFILSLVAVLYSCGNKTIFEATNIQPNGLWNHFKPAVFDFQINDTSKNYQVTLSLKLNSKMQERIIPIVLNMSYPNGESRADNIFLFTDSATKVNGCSEFPLQTYKRFNNSGKYKYQITQITSKYDLEGVEQIGLRVKTTKPRPIAE
jgi:gliding motility-associated lipoprotein GldH